MGEALSDGVIVKHGAEDMAHGSTSRIVAWVLNCLRYAHRDALEAGVHFGYYLEIMKN